MSAVLARLKKASTIKETELVSDSVFFHKRDMIQTQIPMLNVALSGSLDGGFVPGLTVWAGPSKHFKTLFSLIQAKAYMDKYPDAALLFYDSEFGTPISYFNSVGIDTSRVLHTPLLDIEQLKFDIMAQLSEIKRGDRVMIIVDSVGNLASKKEVEDALEQKSVSDMTRAKQIKSLFRMVTPHLNLKNIPMSVVAHIYMTQEMYSKPVVSGGTGIMLSADNVFIMGRQQDKDGTELLGYKFVINVEKSRFVREKSKINIVVGFDSGLAKWSGLMDVALELGAVIKPKVGWYARVNQETGEVESKNWRLADTDSDAFWAPMLTSKTFKEKIEAHYMVSSSDLMQFNRDELVLTDEEESED